MRALTLWQPWASVVAAGAKLVENRPWSPSPKLLAPGEMFAIHAGKKYDNAGRGAAVRVLGVAAYDILSTVSAVPAILGVATYVGHVTTFADCPVGHAEWFSGPYGWILSNVVAVTPIPCRGAQGLWRLPADVESILQARLGKEE